MSLKAPVLFLIFNRPETTARVFAAIREARPETLFVAADGPRPDRSGEKDKCEAARRAVVDNIDWPCEVRTLFREENLGCKRAVSSAIDWFFEAVEEGIILEDDCLPSADFFRYAEALLEKYRNEERVFMISGDNFLPAGFDIRSSYYFSRFAHIWGWATWRRAWKKYDVSLGGFSEFRQQAVDHPVLKDRRSRIYWLGRFQEVIDGQIDTWDHQWTYCLFRNNGLSIVPAVNLISNIGFRQGTHTLHDDGHAGMPAGNLDFPLHMPERITPEDRADAYEKKQVFFEPLSHLILKKLGLFGPVRKIYFYVMQNLRRGN